jgi:hypothetical protein
MKDYSDFPPRKYFMRVLKNCPQSAFLYLQVWQKKDKQKILKTKKSDIRKEYLITPTMFRNLLSPLRYMNLVDFTENNGEYEVDILGSGLDE